MENNEQKQTENVVLEEKQESKLEFGKLFSFLFLLLNLILGIFFALCGGGTILDKISGGSDSFYILGIPIFLLGILLIFNFFKNLRK